MAECPGIWRLAETKDGGLARLRRPGGSITAGQLRAVAAIARDAGNGLIDLTHRANLQIRGLDPRGRDAIVAALDMHGLMAEAPEADRLRNILGSPLAGLDPGEIVDVRPAVRALDQALQASPDLFSLSPKFSFVLDGGGPYGVAAMAHDIALIAEAAIPIAATGSFARFSRAADSFCALATAAWAASVWANISRDSSSPWSVTGVSARSV